MSMTVFDLQNQYRQLTTEEISALSTVPALGTFDGVHLGHAALLSAAVSLAETQNAAPAVWTFPEPPFSGRTRLLTTLSERLSLFASHGIRYAFLTDFSEIRDTPADRFVTDILQKQCSARGAVCGFNFRFGQGAAGTPSRLSEILGNAGFPVLVVDAVTLDGEAVSSTRIRSLLECGETMTAARCLGRCHSICLPVVHGKALGRTIGVPTINQNIPPAMQAPMRGTYASVVSLNGCLYPGVTNLGTRPSIKENDSHTPNAETHIIGYRGWLYDKSVRVFFGKRLRDEKPFPALDALKEQISRDIEASVSAFDETKELCHV
ncbi:MAG: riboflavin biosynthesis protein RibF [Clostridia bacterium]|nr:riboflavin biosynthesis protein RibF [Clostridia bacterium]